MGTHMTLVRDTREYASWLWRATKRLAHEDRRAAVALIASMSVNQGVTFLVFFLPLKVVLLVASDGVSRYFRFFITEETKSAWIAAIVAAILILYVVSIRLDTLAARNASRGAKSLVGSAEQVPITSDPEDFARSTFYRIGETISGLIFSLLTLAVGAVVFPAFFLAIPAILIAEFAVVAIAVGQDPPTLLERFGKFVRETPQELIKWLRQINFLVVFSVLILLFLLVEGLNPLLGIAAILLSRRLFGALKDVAHDSLRLSSDRRLVDALLFPDARVKADRGADREKLLGSALPSARLERLRGLAERAGLDDEVESCTEDGTALDLLQSVDDAVWVDSGQITTAVFDLYGPGVAGSRERLFREYLYAGKASRGIEQHDYLLRFLDAETLRCPSRVLGYREEGLVGRVVDFRGMSDQFQKGWKARREELLQHLWCLDLPPALVEAYDSAHPRLHERLRSELLGPLRVAADEPWARSAYDLVTSRLPRLCERIADLPLTLFNERLTRRNVVMGPDGRSLLLDWTSWTLQPVGAGFAPDGDERRLLEVAAKSACARVGIPEGGLVNEVLLASLLQRMDRLVNDGYPKAALGVAASVLPQTDEADQCEEGQLTDDAAECHNLNLTAQRRGM
jgi:hypothetical protein